MKIKVSSKGYLEKPCANEIGIITNEFKRGNNREVNFLELSKIIGKGHSVLLADYKENCFSIEEKNINYLQCIALDIDSKENKINMYEMITKIYQKLEIYPIIEYCTFSDIDNTKFRLIYRFEDKVDAETYKMFYRAMQWKFKKYLDPATKNANRIWAGTNKKVNYRENDKPISFRILLKLINAYEKKLQKEAKEKQSKYIKSNNNYDYNFDNTRYIKPEFKQEVAEYIINNVSLIDFIKRHYGGYFEKKGNNFVGRCCIHGGDNKNALVVSDRIYTCFTRCGTGNIFSLAKKVYNDENFSNLVFRISNEYNLNISDEYIREVEK